MRRPLVISHAACGGHAPETTLARIHKALELDATRAAEPLMPGALLLTAEALPRWPEARERALTLGLQGVSAFFSGVDEHLIRDCQRSGLALYAWTVDRQADIARLIELGIDGVCTNFPDRVTAPVDGEDRA